MRCEMLSDEVTLERRNGLSRLRDDDNNDNKYIH